MSEKSKNVNRNVNLVGALTGFSRVLGLVREMMTSRLIGAGVEQSAFVFAFTIPNLFRKLFGEGALSSAFVPVFSEEVEHGRLEAAEKIARAVSSMVFMLLGTICVTGILAFSAALPFLDDGGRIATTLRLTRIMLPYAVLICVTAFAMGMLNVFGKFGKAAFAPAILNGVWIVTLMGLFFFPELSLYARVEIVSWSVLLSGLLQMVYLLRAVKRHGMTLKLTFRNWRDGKVLTVWRNTFIGALGMGAVQINLILDNTLALWAAPWAPAAISYAERLVYLPLGVVATAFATVLLPTLSGAFAKGDLVGARKTMMESTEDVLLLTLPAAVGLMLLSTDITKVVYQGGEFTAAETEHVARALMCYAPGLLVFSLNKILLPWFYAQKDMKTPLITGLYMVGANAFLNVLLVITLPLGWKHAGIAGSTVVCALGSSLLLVWKAQRVNGHMGFIKLADSTVRMAGAAILMGAVVVATKYEVSSWMGTGRLAGLVTILIAVAASLVVYGVAVWRLCPVASRRILMTYAKR